jgi:hypothetical protein
VPKWQLKRVAFIGGYGRGQWDKIDFVLYIIDGKYQQKFDQKK